MRVLGKCGGYDSDIQAGMRWAAGLAVPGQPLNPNPARILNLSLGGSGACTAATGYPAVIAELQAAGVVVVAAAGNSAGHAVELPANCPGVIAVAGLRHAGTKVGCSDLGPEISISAPAGNCVNLGAGEPCLYPILSSSNSGTQRPNAGGSTWTDAYDYSVGTCFAAPLAAGSAALMLSARPELQPQEVLTWMQSSARAFPTSGAGNDENGQPVPLCRAPDGSDQLQCYCSVGLCGAGMLDADGAVQAALLAPLARIGLVPVSPQVGDTLHLSAAGSLAGAGHGLVAYAWRPRRQPGRGGRFRRRDGYGRGGTGGAGGRHGGAASRGPRRRGPHGQRAAQHRRQRAVGGDGEAHRWLAAAVVAARRRYCGSPCSGWVSRHSCARGNRPRRPDAGPSDDNPQPRS